MQCGQIDEVKLFDLKVSWKFPFEDQGRSSLTGVQNMQHMFSSKSFVYWLVKIFADF